MKTLLFFLLSGYCVAQVKTVDVCIYGGTSADMIAAYTAKMHVRLYHKYGSYCGKMAE